MKKVLAIILTIVTVFSIVSISAFAEDNTNYGKYNEPESSGDYAYWNGSKVVKSSSTTNDEIKWMQAALNFCKKNIGLSFSSYLAIDGSFGPASKSATLAFQKKYGLSQDGSFGPATIQKMKTVLDNYKKSQNKTTNSTSNTASKITTKLIQNVLDKYGYKTGKYWTTNDLPYSNGSDCGKTVYTLTSDLYASSKPAVSSKTGVKSYKSFNFNNSWECHGFALYVMSKVTGKTVSSSGGKGWTKLTSKPSSLKVGDIVRSNKGHSAVVLSVNGSTCTFAECWGSVNSKINIGKFNGSQTTLSGIDKNYGISYVLRYNG